MKIVRKQHVDFSCEDSLESLDCLPKFLQCADRQRAIISNARRHCCRRHIILPMHAPQTSASHISVEMVVHIKALKHS